jgi:hypothetical protein
VNSVGTVDLFDGLVTVAAVVLSYLASDDITTDNATLFRIEYACLILFAGWIVILIARLARRGHGVFAGVCSGLLLAILWGQLMIGSGTKASWQFEYLIATAALVAI